MELVVARPWRPARAAVASPSPRKAERRDKRLEDRVPQMRSNRFTGCSFATRGSTRLVDPCRIRVSSDAVACQKAGCGIMLAKCGGDHGRQNRLSRGSAQ